MKLFFFLIFFFFFFYKSRLFTINAYVEADNVCAKFKAVHIETEIHQILLL